MSKLKSILKQRSSSPQSTPNSQMSQDTQAEMARIFAAFGKTPTPRMPTNESQSELAKIFHFYGSTTKSSSHKSTPTPNTPEDPLVSHFKSFGCYTPIPEPNVSFGSKSQTPTPRAGAMTRCLAKQLGATPCEICSHLHPDPCTLCDASDKVSRSSNKEIKRLGRSPVIAKLKSKKRSKAKSPVRRRSKTLARPLFQNTIDLQTEAMDVEMKDISESNVDIPFELPAPKSKIFKSPIFESFDNLNDLQIQQIDGKECQISASSRFCQSCGRFPQPSEITLERITKWLSLGLQPLPCVICTAVDEPPPSSSQSSISTPVVAAQDSKVTMSIWGTGKPAEDVPWANVSSIKLVAAEGQAAARALDNLTSQGDNLEMITASQVSSSVLALLERLICRRRSLTHIKLSSDANTKLVFSGRWIADCDSLKEFKISGIAVKELDSFPKGLEFLKIDWALSPSETGLLATNYKELVSLKILIDEQEEFGALKKITDGFFSTFRVASSLNLNQGFSPGMFANFMNLPRIEKLDLRFVVRGSFELLKRKLTIFEHSVNSGDFGLNRTANVELVEEFGSNFLSMRVVKN